LYQAVLYLPRRIHRVCKSACISIAPTLA
jgi:hypothetical protein